MNSGRSQTGASAADRAATQTRGRKPHSLAAGTSGFNALRIDTGKLADLIVLDRNLFELDQADISDTQVLLTLMEGNPVFGDFSAF